MAKGNVQFVVVSTQRTGSTMLIKLLDSHPAVLCPGEIFFPGSGSEYAIRRYVAKSGLRKLRHEIARAALVREFLDQFYDQPGCSAVGFKYMYSQARRIPRLYPSVVDYIIESGMPVIHGVRNNLLRVVISRIASKSSGVYRSTDALQLQPVHVPVRNLRKALSGLHREKESWQRRFSGQPYLQVSYESLLSQRTLQERRLLDFIGVEYHEPLTSPFQKMSSGSIRNLVANFDQVKRELMGSEFEWCVEDENP